MNDEADVREPAARTSEVGGASEPATPRTSPAPTGSDAFEEAGSEIVQLILGFVEEVGTHRRDARSAAESARADRAEALRIRQETMKLRAEAESEAAKIIDAARADADRMRQDAEAAAADVEGVFRTTVAQLDRAQESVAEVLDRLRGNVDPRAAAPVVVIPDAPDKAATES